MKRDQIMIFIFIGLMVFSSLAVGLLFLTSDSANEALSEQAAAEQEELLAGLCTSSDESLANTGTPVGEWPATIDDPLKDIVVEDLREGAGGTLALGDCISVHYRLSLADGTPVSGNDTFSDLGEPIAFELAEGQLIEGWTVGLPGMKEGGFRRLLVPAALAYGDATRPGIPGGSDLIFDVELVKIEE